MPRPLLLAGLAAAIAVGATGCAGIPPLPPQASIGTVSPDEQPGGETAPATPEVDPGATPTDPPSADAADPVQLDVATDPRVVAQVDYVLEYWSDYNDEEWGVLERNDCVNFASQSLVVRGWKQSAEWYHGGDPYSSSATWRSSTAMRDWLESRPDLATPLGDDQRDQVQLGDLVQFDWDNSGDRDHTGVVTRIERSAGGVKVYFAGHTLDSDYRDVDVAITKEHPGASVYYWRLAA
ncbi:amidase domain-containing protein [Agromyces sp. NPDC056523]|uniref:amidase domain-containing protein n=1 Tax=Agromyces sp. NPDC056523 TaxID=3345850 RepID=UPI00366CC2D9